MLERYESGITIERVLERAAKVNTQHSIESESDHVTHTQAKRGIVESNVFKEVKTTGGHASSPQTSASNESSSAGTEAEKRLASITSSYHLLYCCVVIGVHYIL